MKTARSMGSIGALALACATLTPSILCAQGGAKGNTSAATSQPPVTGDAAGTEIEEVLVTAQRRVTSLQTTAAAITALSESALLSRSIDDVQDLGRLSPSMDVSFYQGEAQIYIRGIGYTGLIGGTDSSTAFHMNGVYLSRSAAAVPAFFDVERVEVVRGPQGTLYGRNATGGSVNVITKGPTNELTSTAMLTVGDHDDSQLFGAVGGPVAGERLSARLAVQAEDRSGFTKATRRDGSVDDIEDKRDLTARLSVRLHATDTLDLDLIGDYYKAGDAGSIWLYFGSGTGTNPFLRQFIAAQGGAAPEAKSRHIGSDVEPFDKPEVWGLTGRATWKVNDYTLTSLTGYRGTRPANFNDLDITTANAITQLRIEDQKQFSQELQVVSPSGRDLEWIFGLYYFDETNDVRNEYEFPFIDEMFGLPVDPTCCRLRLDGRATTRAHAAFGEVNYDLTPRLNLLVGGRYSRERRGGRNDVEFVNFPVPGFNNAATFAPATFNSFTPKVGLNFALTDTVFTYASASRGFKSGGFNIGSYQNTPFNPEKIWSYEVGMKSDLLERRLRFNLAAFYYDYTDLQVQDVEGNNTVVRNAATAGITGVELESTALITQDFQFDFNATWLGSEFKDTCLADPKHPLPQPAAGCTGPGQRNLQGLQLPRAPKFKMSVGAQYTHPFNDGSKLVLRGDYARQTRVYFSAFEIQELSQKGYGWLKARVNYVRPGGRWQFSAFIDNATNEEVISNATYIADIVDSTITGNMAPPRTYGAQVRYQF
ncbi:MAG: TonB-dependent receptor [Gammaproteobacteria bacterium]